MNFDPSATVTDVDVIKRLEALQKCLKSIENFFQTWDRVAPAKHVGLTFMAFMQLLHVIVALFRLSTLDGIPGWDPNEARTRLPLFTLLDHVAERMQMSISAIPVQENDPVSEGSSKSHFVGGLVCPRAWDTDEFVVLYEPCRW